MGRESAIPVVPPTLAFAGNHIGLPLPAHSLRRRSSAVLVTLDLRRRLLSPAGGRSPLGSGGNFRRRLPGQALSLWPALPDRFGLCTFLRHSLWLIQLRLIIGKSAGVSRRGSPHPPPPLLTTKAKASSGEGSHTTPFVFPYHSSLQNGWASECPTRHVKWKPLSNSTSTATICTADDPAIVKSTSVCECPARV